MAGPDASQSGPSQRVLFEFTQLGQQIRVAAIDEATGTEVVVICPPQLGQAQMQRLALGKLRHKLGLPPTRPRRRLARASGLRDGSADPCQNPLRSSRGTAIGPILAVPDSY